MKRLPPLHLLPLLALALAAQAFAAGLPDANISFTAEQAKSLNIQLAKPVSTAQASSGSLTAKVVAAPDAEWVVTAPASGVVVRVGVAEGDRVARSAVLAELRSAETPQMGAELVQAESAAKLARSERDRDVQLHREGIIAQRRVQASEQALAQAQSQLAAVRMRFKLMGVSAQDASQGRLTIRAPAGATVLERLVTPGQRVNEADPLLRLVDASRLMLELKVPVGEAAFKVGDALALPDGQQATVRQVGWGASEDAQAVRVRADLPAASSGSLRPGQWLKVQRQTVQTQIVWNVPAAAVARHEQQSVVFVRSAKGFTATPVTVLSSDALTATVTGAFSADAQLAASGTIAIKGAWLGHGGGE